MFFFCLRHTQTRSVEKKKWNAHFDGFCHDCPQICELSFIRTVFLSIFCRNYICFWFSTFIFLIPPHSYICLFYHASLPLDSPLLSVALTLSFSLSATLLDLLTPPPFVFFLSLPIQIPYLRMKVIWVWWFCWFCSPWSSSPPSFPSSLSCGKTHTHTHTHTHTRIPHPQATAVWSVSLSFSLILIFFFFFFFFIKQSHI